MTGRPGDRAPLRRRAEERLRQGGPESVSAHADDPRRLLHELEVHRIELEMQNEELLSARRETEAALRRYTALFDFAPVGYLVTEPDGLVREVNFAGARLLDQVRTRIVGRRLGVFLTPDHRQAFTEFLVQVFAAGEDGELVSCEVEIDRGPEHRLAMLGGVRLQGDPACALIVAEDITERRRSEQALLEEARNKDSFLGMLSHELRNPLAPIRNSLYVLARVDAGSEPARRAQAVIDRQVTHLTRIVDDLLDVTRIARGKIRLQRARIELGELVRRTMDDHRPLFETGGVTLEARFGSELFWLDGDETRLTQVLGNLLANAVKFTSRGDRVEVSLRREGRMAALSVRDTGIGMEPNMLGWIFEPFSQGPQSLDRAQGGLGLGLAMARGLVELHGGTIQVRSDGPGRGAEFTVHLPLAPGPAEPEARPGIRQVRPMRVLVIEDNMDAAESLQEALRLWDHDVKIVDEGRRAIEEAHGFRPEVVICDIGMPGMDGYDVARAFRADRELKDSYLVALTGYALPEDLERAREAGFDRHVVKPPSLDALQQLMAGIPEPE